MSKEFFANCALATHDEPLDLKDGTTNVHNCDESSEFSAGRWAFAAWA